MRFIERSLLNVYLRWLIENYFRGPPIQRDFAGDTHFLVLEDFLRRTELWPITSPNQSSEELVGIRFIQIQKGRLTASGGRKMRARYSAAYCGGFADM
jgi:hypothetical protein